MTSSFSSKSSVAQWFVLVLSFILKGIASLIRIFTSVFTLKSTTPIYSKSESRDFD
jgi:hypothetical protein